MTGSAGESCRLVADVGGTNIRFAIADGAGLLRRSLAMPRSNFNSFEAALEFYLAFLGKDEDIASAAVAAAGPVADGQIELTNGLWRITDTALRDRLGPTVRVRLFNDLEAVACALPHLASSDLDVVRPGTPATHAAGRMLAVNVGTGFGAATLIRSGEGWVSCPSEAGHMTLGAEHEDDLALFRSLGLSAPTIEDILSGAGCQRLAQVFYESSGVGAERGAAMVADFDLGDDSPAANFVAEHITRTLARSCANLVLASAAWDGVYMTGSVVAAWRTKADVRQFEEHFVGAGKMSAMLARTPVSVIRGDMPALTGLANASLP